ncbi:MAG: hypothetical protein R3B13_09925 [Polyangiaceae bacterium]
MRTWLVATAAILTLIVSTPALADEPQRPERFDPSDYPPPHARWNLLLAGAGATAVWYGTAVGFSYLWPDAPGAKDLRIPVAGPWMALADTGCASDDPNCSTFTVVLRAILTTMDAIGQTGGVAVMVEAAVMPTREAAPPTRRRLPPLRLQREDAGIRWQPVPFTAGRDGLGLGIAGQF